VFEAAVLSLFIIVWCTSYKTLVKISYERSVAYAVYLILTPSNFLCKKQYQENV
jgi:hypothetical protein